MWYIHWCGADHVEDVVLVPIYNVEVASAKGDIKVTRLLHEFHNDPLTPSGCLFCCLNVAISDHLNYPEFDSLGMTLRACHVVGTGYS